MHCEGSPLVVGIFHFEIDAYSYVTSFIYVFRLFDQRLSITFGRSPSGECYALVRAAQSVLFFRTGQFDRLCSPHTRNCLRFCLSARAGDQIAGADAIVLADTYNARMLSMLDARSRGPHHHRIAARHCPPASSIVLGHQLISQEGHRRPSSRLLCSLNAPAACTHSLIPSRIYGAKSLTPS